MSPSSPVPIGVLAAGIAAVPAVTARRREGGPASRTGRGSEGAQASASAAGVAAVDATNRRYEDDGADLTDSATPLPTPPRTDPLLFSPAGLADISSQRRPVPMLAACEGTYRRKPLVRHPHAVTFPMGPSIFVGACYGSLRVSHDVREDSRNSARRVMPAVRPRRPLTRHSGAAAKLSAGGRGGGRRHSRASAARSAMGQPEQLTH